MRKTPQAPDPSKNVVREKAMAGLANKDANQTEPAAPPKTAEANLRGGFYERSPDKPPAEPPPENLASALKQLAQTFQSRNRQLVSVLEGGTSEDAQDRAHLEKLSARYANQSLLEAQRAQEDVLKQLLAATDQKQTDQLKALQEAIAALRTNIETLNQKDSVIENDIKEAEARRKQATDDRKKALEELGKADEALAKTLLSTLKKAIEMKPSQPKPPDPKPRPVIEPLGDEDAARVTDQTDMLRLQKRSVEFDHKVLQAIDVIAKFSRKWRPPVIDALREWGLSTKVEQVIRTLDRRRLTDVRRQVLDAALPGILAGLINDKGREAFAKMARDSVGLADEIISRLDRPDGPLDEVVSDVAVRAIKERGLEDSKANRDRLESYLRRSFEEPRA